MGKALNTIIAATVAVGVFIVAGPQAAAYAFAATQAVLSVVNPLKAPKPDTVVSAQKQAIPPRIRATGRSRLHWYWALFETSDKGKSVDVGAFMDGPAALVEKVYLNDDVVAISGGVVQALPDKKYQGGNVKAGYTVGAVPNTAFAPVTAEIPAWTSAYRGDGVVTGYLIKNPEKDKYFSETYPQGDNVEMSLVAQWGYQYDPRDPAQNIADNPALPSMWSGGDYIGSWKWTENPVLHLLWYLVFDRGYEYNKRILPAIEFWKSAANICDEAVSLKTGGTEPRYRSCVSYAATSQEKEVIGSFIETFDGWMQERGDGAFVIYAGKIYTPTVSIGPDDIHSINIQDFVETENTVEQIKVTYISAAHDYTEVDATPWGGEGIAVTRVATLDAATPSFSQNRRLAKRVMDRTNATPSWTISTILTGKKVRGQRYINLYHAEEGYTYYNGIVEVTKVTRNFESGGLDIECVAVDPNIDSWNPATEEGEGAAVGDRVAPEPLTPPTITNATAIYDQSGQDSTGTRISVTVEGAGNRDDLKWYLRWKKSSASVWNEAQYDDTDPSAAVVLVTGFVPTDTGIDLQAEYQIGDGRLSEYSATYTLDTSTDAIAPDPAVSVTLTNWSDTLDLVTDYIARARSYRWRFYADDGTTLIRTLLTSGRTVSYTSAQAATDGARRAYVVKVAGINGAGAGTEATTGVLTLIAPPAVTGVTATGGASNAEIDFDLQTTPNVAGYSVAYSTAANFDPLTQGTIQRSYGSPTYLQSLAAATFYAKVAAFDAWTDRPDLLNYSAPEVMFTITTGGGGTGGGGGGGGGGYCPVEDECILMADGTTKAAGKLVVGDMVWTQHEHTMEWGAYPVTVVEIVDSDDVYSALGFKATAGHRTWLSGVWNRHDALGVKVAGTFKVVRITVKDAHTYVCAGVLSHNIKQNVNEA